jgi:hypothetical protein
MQWVGVCALCVSGNFPSRPCGEIPASPHGRLRDKGKGANDVGRFGRTSDADHGSARQGLPTQGSEYLGRQLMIEITSIEPEEQCLAKFDWHGVGALF